MIANCWHPGLYLVIYYLLLLEDRNVTNAILSLIPILSGIFLIFPWVLVDQLYVKLKETKIVIEMDNPITRSLSSLSIVGGQQRLSRPVSRSNTVRSNRSCRSVKSMKSVRSVKSVRDVKKRSDVVRHNKLTNQFHFRSDIQF